MAGGWKRDGAVQDQIDDTVEDAVAAAGRPVAVRQGPVLATAFHPELTGDRRVHGLFVDMVRATL